MTKAELDNLIAFLLQMNMKATAEGIIYHYRKVRVKL